MSLHKLFCLEQSETPLGLVHSVSVCGYRVYQPLTNLSIWMAACHSSPSVDNLMAKRTSGQEEESAETAVG